MNAAKFVDERVECDIIPHIERSSIKYKSITSAISNVVLYSGSKRSRILYAGTYNYHNTYNYVFFLLISIIQTFNINVPNINY